MKVKEREVPQLQANEGSWMIVRVSNREPVIEVFKNSKAAGHLKHLSAQFVAVPIQSYLREK